ncbi:MAG: hypothetical protein MZV63_66335 [Marinilabiliales bacterium]|nr:hypothetical protein [Marinilabiliales bacterium]
MRSAPHRAERNFHLSHVHPAQGRQPDLAPARRHAGADRRQRRRLPDPGGRPPRPGDGRDALRGRPLRHRPLPGRRCRR